MSEEDEMDACCNKHCREGRYNLARSTGPFYPNRLHFSSFYATLALVRYPLGISLFLLPWAMKFGGIVAGPIFVAVLIIVNAYRSLVLTKVAEELTESGVTAPAGFSDWWLLENSLGKIRRTSVNCYLVMFSAVQWLSLLGHACTFLAFAGLTFNQAFPNENWPGIEGERICIGICVASVIVFHVITQWLRNLCHGSKGMCVGLFSGTFLIFLPVLIVIFISIPIIVNFAASLVTAPYGTLQNKSRFSVLLVLIGLICTVILAGFGITIFLALAEETCGSVTFNMPLTDARSYVTVRVLSAVAALIFVGYRHQIEPELSSRLTTAEIVCDIVFKVIFLAVAGALAVGIPSFSGLACIFGSLTSFTMTLTFPFFCDVMLHVTGGRAASRDLDDEGRDLISQPDAPEADREISGARVARDVIFMILGLAGMLYGLYNTVIYLQYHGINNSTEGCAYVPITNSSIY